MNHIRHKNVNYVLVDGESEFEKEAIHMDNPFDFKKDSG